MAPAILELEANRISTARFSSLAECTAVIRHARVAALEVLDSAELPALLGEADFPSADHRSSTNSIASGA
ncbi:hypothetical protein C6V04_05165 [Burkholderia multivorans]|nr:hypothetical protein C6V04_05165 [Burkholderia multivorans]